MRAPEALRDTHQTTDLRTQIVPVQTVPTARARVRRALQHSHGGRQCSRVRTRASRATAHAHTHTHHARHKTHLRNAADPTECEPNLDSRMQGQPTSQDSTITTIDEYNEDAGEQITLCTHGMDTATMIFAAAIPPWVLAAARRCYCWLRRPGLRSFSARECRPPRSVSAASLFCSAGPPYRLRSHPGADSARVRGCGRGC